MENEILNYLVENGIIDLPNVKQNMLMSKRIKYLKMHEFKIWQGNDGKWCTYIPDKAKKRKFVKKGTKEELENIVIAYYEEEVESPYFDELFEEWVAKKLEYGEVQQQTYERYNNDFERFIKSTSLCNIRVSKIDQFMIEDFAKSTIKKFHLTAKCWANVRLIISGCFKYAKKKGYTQLSITETLADIDISNKSFKKIKREAEDNVWTDEEISRLKEYLLDGTPTPRKLAVLTALYTGMRVGEIAALKKEDVFDDYIYVNRTQVSYHDDTGKRILETRDSPKTDAGIRKIGIIKSLSPILKRAMLISDCEYVFSDKGTFLKKDSISKTLVYACRHLGIKERSIHTLRKTFATNLINAGLDKATITYVMGHTDIAVTEKYYYYRNENVNDLIKSVQTAINY